MFRWVFSIHVASSIDWEKGFLSYLKEWLWLDLTLSSNYLLHVQPVLNVHGYFQRIGINWLVDVLIWFFYFCRYLLALLFFWNLTFCDPMDYRPSRLLCSWNSPGKNTRVGSHSLLQRIFPTQGSNLGLSHCRQILYHLSHQGRSFVVLRIY